MQIREKLKRRVIELIHGFPYDEAVEKEFYRGLPITIGRVMKVLSGTTGEGGNFYKYIYSPNDSEIQMLYYENGQITLNTIICFWKLTKENGQECTDDDQKDETIEKIYNLIK